MKENKMNDAQKKDYYFSVLVSQIIVLILILMLFFFLKAGQSGAELNSIYRNLLKEDFLTYNVSSAVSRMKDYFASDDKIFAVFGNRVESVEVTSAQVEETTTEENTTVTEKETEPPSAEVLATVEVSRISVKSEKEAVNPQPMTFKNTDTKKQEMIFPVEGGRYTSYFGERTDPISEEEDDYHNGVDIGADEGDEILAVYDGTVSLVGEDDHSGKYIFLSHDDSTVTFYCHCSEILLDEGDTVSQGDVIALVGSTGYSTGPHLHFELRIDGESTDPLPLLENAD